MLKVVQQECYEQKNLQVLAQELQRLGTADSALRGLVVRGLVVGDGPYSVVQLLSYYRAKDVRIEDSSVALKMKALIPALGRPTKVKTDQNNYRYFGLCFHA